jgi:Uma2 family endonuclease
LRYLGAELHAAECARLLDGPPILAVEVLSRSEKLEQIDKKLEHYLAAQVPLVWVVHPRFETVTVYQPATPPVLYNNQQDLSGDPHLPGFRVPVAALFGR